MDWISLSTRRASPLWRDQQWPPLRFLPLVVSIHNHWGIKIVVIVRRECNTVVATAISSTLRGAMPLVRDWETLCAMQQVSVCVVVVNVAQQRRQSQCQYNRNSFYWNSIALLPLLILQSVVGGWVGSVSAAYFYYFIIWKLCPLPMLHIATVASPSSHRRSGFAGENFINHAFMSFGSVVRPFRKFIWFPLHS